MKVYQLHSTKLPEPVTFKYNSSGILTAFESVGLTDDQLHYLFDRFPVREQWIAELRAKYKMKFVQVPLEVDFDLFFNNYSTLYGARVDKKVAEQRWNRLTKAKQIAAVEFIPRYFNRCKSLGVAPKYAKTYLNQEPWID